MSFPHWGENLPLSAKRGHDGVLVGGKQEVEGWVHATRGTITPVAEGFKASACDNAWGSSGQKNVHEMTWVAPAAGQMANTPCTTFSTVHVSGPHDEFQSSWVWQPSLSSTCRQIMASAQVCLITMALFHRSRMLRYDTCLVPAAGLISTSVNT